MTAEEGPAGIFGEEVDFGAEEARACGCLWMKSWRAPGGMGSRAPTACKCGGRFLKQKPRKGLGLGFHIGALISRIGFWCILYIIL